jgi:hypothetical protein
VRHTCSSAIAVSYPPSPEARASCDASRALPDRAGDPPTILIERIDTIHLDRHRAA